MNQHINTFFAAAIGLSTLLTTGCKSVVRERNPVPRELIEVASIQGIPGARHWADFSPEYKEKWLQKSKEEVQAEFAGIIGKPHHYLGISGGGANGAYGAGLLVGWSASGTRPEFTMVTGISTGSIMAPFAFLGSEYDDVLILLYTQYTTDEILKTRSLLKGIRGDAFTDLSPLREIINDALTDEALQKIGEEHKKGRRLLLGTVNMDSLRPVTWNIGAIAASGHPRTRELILDVIIASASIPVAFPPVFIDVEANGTTYQEIHVDGGLASQVFVYPHDLDWKIVRERMQPEGVPQVYVIRNAKLEPKWEPVEAKILPLGERSIASLIRTQGIGDLQEIYLTTQRDGLELNLAYIPADFDEPQEESFDRAFMNKLFDRGYQDLVQGKAWSEKR